MTISIRYFPAPVSDTESSYEVDFYGDSIHTTVTHDPGVVSNWISLIEYIHWFRLHRLIVGLDVEWRPSFSRHISNPVATLQLCVGRRCLVYQILHSSYIPESLSSFLSSENYTFVGVNIGSDLAKLQRDYDIGYCANALDLRGLAAEEYQMNELQYAGLKRLASVVLEREVDKPRRVTLSRWDNRWLSLEQVQYACVDAFVSFEIGKILNASDY